MKYTCRTLITLPLITTTFGFMLTSCNSTTDGTSPGHASTTPESSSDSLRRKALPGVCEAVISGDINKVQNALASHGSANSICPGAADMPVLAVAARHGDVAIVQTLINAGADVNGANSAGYTALENAAIEGRTAVARALLQAGASAEPRAGDGSTALDTAAIFCQAEMVTLLLSAGASVHSRDDLKQTPLSYAVMGANCAQVVQVLIQAGSDVNAVEDVFGDTPLLTATRWCSKKGIEQTIAYLLDAGAIPLIANRTGVNAVARASSCGNAQVYRMTAERARLFLASPGRN